ncbi:MAG: extracellular solute-binding protein [Chitinispirillales bacterium]|jgi:maltose-binding protein MalE|nr:extracellular solute-binding protein [Chitinispirillales bacterium]
MKKTSALIFTVICILTVFSCVNEKSRKQLVVIVNSVPARQRYLYDEVFPKFEKLYKCKIILKSYESNEELKDLLSQDSIISSTALVSVPLEIMRDLALSGKIAPLSDIVASHVLLFDAASYNERFSDIGKVKGVYYYYPNQIEVPILFYVKSKVAAAIEKYADYEEEINAVLKIMNGFGLPCGYTVNENPNEWDMYDIFVIGYIWMKERYKNEEEKTGRILLQDAKRYYGMNMLFYNAFALGAKWENIEKMSGDAVEEVFLWEMVFGKYSIFNPLSYKKEVLPADIYNAFRKGEIFMAYFSQNDCFNIMEGTDESNMRPYISDASDVGIALVPLIVPFTLDEYGDLAFEGARISALKGYYWGIPSDAKEKELAYILLQYLNNRSQITKDAVRFGDIPVREDVLMNLQNIYEEKWLGDGYTAAALRQTMNYFDAKYLPLNGGNDSIVSDNYIYMRDLIKDVSYQPNEINKNSVRSLIKQNYSKKDEK